MDDALINEKLKGNLEGGRDNLDLGLDSDRGEEEDDEVIEIDIDEAVKELAKQWTGVAHFNSVSPFNMRGLFDDMKRAWGIQQNLGVKALKGNMFFLEFESGCDERRTFVA